MTQLKFKYAILYVKDVAATLEFYHQAFGFEKKMLHESGDYGELDTGATSLSFSSLELMQNLGKTPEAVNKNRPSFEIAFESDDVAGDLDRALNCGAELVQAVEHMPWGQTTAYVHDINGFLVEICSPIQA